MSEVPLMEYENPSSGDPLQGNPSFPGLDLISIGVHLWSPFQEGPFLRGALGKQYGDSLWSPRSRPFLGSSQLFSQKHLKEGRVNFGSQSKGREHYALRQLVV